LAFSPAFLARGLASALPVPKVGHEWRVSIQTAGFLSLSRLVCARPGEGFLLGYVPSFVLAPLTSATPPP